MGVKVKVSVSLPKYCFPLITTDQRNLLPHVAILFFQIMCLVLLYVRMSSEMSLFYLSYLSVILDQ